MRWIVLVVALLMSGCLEAEVELEPDALVDDVPVDNAPWVTKLTGGLTGAGYCGGVLPTAVAGSMELPASFGVRKNSVALILETQFEGPFARSCIALVDGGGGVHQFDQGQLAVMQNAMRIEMADPQPGEWEVYVYFDGPAAVTYEMVASSFLVEPPSDYTAW